MRTLLARLIVPQGLTLDALFPVIIAITTVACEPFPTNELADVKSQVILPIPLDRNVPAVAGTSTSRTSR